MGRDDFLTLVAAVLAGMFVGLVCFLVAYEAGWVPVR